MCLCVIDLLQDPDATLLKSCCSTNEKSAKAVSGVRSVSNTNVSSAAAALNTQPIRSTFQFSEKCHQIVSRVDTMAASQAFVAKAGFIS